MIAGWITALLVVLAAFSTRFAPTAEDMRFSFDQAQKFYASAAYDQAIGEYERINKAESRFIDERKITVSVGNLIVPIREAALYQSGNSYFKMSEEAQNRAEQAKEEEERSRSLEEATRYFDRARFFFRRVESEATVEKLRALAQKRLMDVLYRFKDYGGTIKAGERLLEKYSSSPYVIDAMYNIGWSYYETGQYERSIEIFGRLTQQFPKDYRADRALFQIGESYYSQGKYEEAARYYQELVDKQHIEQLTEQDIQKMQRDKLAGLIDETALELAGKAQLKVGDCYAELGDLNRAEKAYKRVVVVFAREPKLVQEAYIRLANRYYQQGDLNASVRVYRDAIDKSSDKIFQARMQSLLAKQYYDSGYFKEAIREYQLYQSAYDRVADQIGFSLAEAEYKIGRSFFDVGERFSSEGDREQAEKNYAEAISHYQRLLRDWPESPLVVAAAFNIALSHQMMGKPEALQTALEGFTAIMEDYPEDEYVPSSLLQIARIYYIRKEYDRSVASYRRMLSEYPDVQSDVVTFELGLALRDQGKGLEAVEACLQVPSTSVLFAKARLEAGQILISQNRFEQTVALLNGALEGVKEEDQRVKIYYLIGKAFAGKKEYAKAAKAFAHVIEKTTEKKLLESALYGRGVSYFSLARYEEAEKDLKRLLESEDLGIRNSAQKMLGMAFIRQNKEQEAIGQITRLVSITEDPSARAEYLLLLAELYYGTRQYDHVIEVTQRILKLDVEDKKAEQPYYIKEKAYFLLGEGYKQTGQQASVIATYREGLKRYPDAYYSADMLFGLAFADFQQGALYDAAVHFQRFVSKYPDHANVPYAQYYLGYALYNQAVFDRSVEVFSELGRRFPNTEVSSDALYRAGESAFNLGQFERAMTFYRTVFEDYPRSEQADDALYNMAWSLLELGRDQEAVGYLERLLTEFPKSAFGPNARFTLGDDYYNRGEYEKALQEYQKVLYDYPDDEVASRVPDILDDLKETVAYLDYEKARAVFSEALANEDVEGFKKAVALFEEIVRKHPGTESAIGALSNMGVSYEYLHRWKDAVSAYDQVITNYEAGKATPDAYRFARTHKEWIVASRL